MNDGNNILLFALKYVVALVTKTFALSGAAFAPFGCADDPLADRALSDHFLVRFSQKNGKTSENRAQNRF